MSQLVFELSDVMRLSAWWSIQRGRLLERAIGDNYATPAVAVTQCQGWARFDT